MYNSYGSLTILLVMLFSVSSVKGNPKKYHDESSIGDSGFQPSSNIRYYETDLPQNLGKKSQNVTKTSLLVDNVKVESKDRLQRFGLPTYTSATGTNSYNTNSGVSYTNPVKIDIGGVALGAILGLGLVLFIPKLANIFSLGHEYRSLDNDGMSSIVTDLLSNVDRSLEKLNIDSSSCVQRIVCNYVNEAEKNTKQGKATTIEETVNSITSNALFSYVLDGTAIKEAVEIGRKGEMERCSSFYTKCPVNKENFMQIATALLPETNNIRNATKE